MELYIKYGLVLITNAVILIKRKHLNLLPFSLKTLILIQMERVPLNVPDLGEKI